MFVSRANVGQNKKINAIVANTFFGTWTIVGKLKRRHITINEITSGQPHHMELFHKASHMQNENQITNGCYHHHSITENCFNK